VTIDWTAIAALASAAGALAAAAGVWVAGRQLRTSADIAKQTQGIDLLFRLRNEWNSPPMQEGKRKAAELLLAKKPDEGTVVADVLDFFETVALLLNQGVIDARLTWHIFYHWMVHFYAAANAPDYAGASYISLRRRLEGPKQWEDLDKAIPILLHHEGRHDLPGTDEVTAFLRDESGTA
jgi:hypothetical protein